MAKSGTNGLYGQKSSPVGGTKDRPPPSYNGLRSGPQSIQRHMEAPVAPLSGEVALDHANLGPGLAKPQVGSNGMTFATRTQAPFADPVFVPPRPFGER